MKKLTPIQIVDKKKKENVKLLQGLANEKCKNKVASMVYSAIGIKVNKTGQTILNYISGNAKDGYLLDAIIEEFKML